MAKEIVAFNLKGAKKTFSEVAWKMMKVLPDGSRSGGWREFKEGVDLSKQIAGANVPDSLRNTKAKSTSEAEIGNRIRKEVDEKLKAERPQLIEALKAELTIDIESQYKDKVSDAVDEATDRLKTEYGNSKEQVEKISDYLLEKHRDVVGDPSNNGGTAADMIISVIEKLKATPPAPAEKEGEDKTSTKKSK